MAICDSGETLLQEATCIRRGRVQPVAKIRRCNKYVRRWRTDAVLAVSMESIALTTDTLGSECAAFTVVRTSKLFVTPVTAG